MDSFVPNADLAQFDAYTGKTFMQPPDQIADDFTPDGPFFQQLQSEVLNLIQILKRGAVKVPVINHSGGDFAKGTLVVVSGYDLSSDKFEIEAASNGGNAAELVLLAAIANNAAGYGYNCGLVENLLDTSGASAGDAVYLDSGGVATLILPASGSQFVQRVGFVVTVDALGSIFFFLHDADKFGALNYQAQSVGTSALADGAVTDAKISTALAAEIQIIALTFAAETSDHIDVTVQLRDAQNNALARNALIEVWLSDSALGWETATAADSLTVMTGTAADVPSAAKRIRVITDSSGTAVIRVAKTGAQSWYFVAALGNKLLATQITFT